MAEVNEHVTVELSTGQKFEVSAPTLQDGINGYTQLVDAIVMEHLGRVGECNDELFGGVTREILHVVKNAEPDSTLLALVGLHCACFGRIEGFMASQDASEE